MAPPLAVLCATGTLDLHLIVASCAAEVIEEVLLSVVHVRRLELSLPYCQCIDTVLSCVTQASALHALQLSPMDPKFRESLSSVELLKDLILLTQITTLSLEDLEEIPVAAIAGMTWLSHLCLKNIAMLGQQSSPELDEDGLSFIGCLQHLSHLELSCESLLHSSCAFLHQLSQLTACYLSACSLSPNVQWRFAYARSATDACAALVGIPSLVKLKLFAYFPELLAQDLSSWPVNSQLCHLEYKSYGFMPASFANFVGALTLLTNLSLTAGSFAPYMSALSALKILKSLTMHHMTGPRSKPSVANLAFLVELQSLASLKLHSFLFKDTAFAQSSRLVRLTALELLSCPWITDGILLQLKGLISLRELQIYDCSKMTLNMRESDAHCLSVYFMLSHLRRLKRIMIC